MKRALSLVALLLAVLLPAGLSAQGVTTSSVRAVVRDTEGKALAGSRVTAVHQPSGTVYGGTTGADGRVVIPGMRVGGPYQITSAAIGFEKQVRDNVFLTLGVSTDLAFEMRQAAVALSEITVTAERVFSSERTGAATTVPAQAIQQLPTVSGRLEDFTRLTPQVRGSSFAGQDGRLNNITVDGAYFNNSFGLGSGQPGGRTDVAPISMDAIEQVQVNIAPYDVRQGNFVGAGVNTVTKSGTNDWTGSLYYAFRNDGLVGTTAGPNPFNPGTFNYAKIGGYFGGPIIRNKLFFFVSYEGDALEGPGTTFTANTGSQTVGGSTTRVLKSDLDALSAFLQQNFDYETGGYEGYNFETPSTRLMAKLDYNLNERHKFSLRYTGLNSDTDQLVSNSSSLGFGNRRTSTDALNFQNSNYKQLENIRSIVGEWNAVVGSNMSNNLIIGYSDNDENRGYVGSFFPLADILKDGVTYTTFGFEPFTPNNELKYKSFQVQNNFTIYGNKHDLTFGVTAERYRSENVFFPGSQSAYVYSSLQDFYTDANDYLANPNRTTSPVTLRRFQVRWSNIPGQEKPIQPLEVTYVGAYAQDEWRASDRLTLTLGLRVDVPYFGETGYANPEANAMTFKDELGAAVKYQTEKLPDANPLFSPRFGFNWNAVGDRSTQIRGGSGIFTGRPAYVWISNQIGNNGMLTGFESRDNTTARPWNPDPNAYKPATVTGAPASSYELALTDPGYRFPQLWRSNLAIDQKLPWGLIATGEFIYNRDVNGTYYINANQQTPNGRFVGADDRPRWIGSNRIYSKISNAIVLKNQNDGYAWDASVALEKAFSTGLFLKAAYSYGESKNTVDPGSIAFGSWNNNQHSGNGNTPGLAYSQFSPGHRGFFTASYKRDFFGFGATMVSLFWEARTIGNLSYTFSGDLNGDGGTSNDLIYIPRDKSEMNFETYTASGVTYTAQQQADAWEAFIAQDDYLSANRGKFAERGAVFLPMVKRADFAFSQDLSTLISKQRNTLQFRLDILNVGNLINSDWGVGQRLVTNTPLVIGSGRPTADSQGRAVYRLRAINNQLISKSLEATNSFADVYRLQFGFRYLFN
jgi:hypothetical protein